MRHYSSLPATKLRQSTRLARVNLPKENINVTKLDNGLVVTSLENHSPVYRMAAVVKAGARYEPYDSRGVTNFLRVYSNLSTKYVSRLGLTKNLERLGASFNVHGAQFLVPVVSCPLFKPYEIHDEKARIQVDRDLYLQTPELQLNDILHEAAFKGGLSRPLSVSDEMIHKLNHRQMYAFHSKYFTPDRLSLVGVGLNHNVLVQLADKFKFTQEEIMRTPGFGNVTPIENEPEPVKYKGGEIRTNQHSGLVHIALAFEGVSWPDKNLLASELIGQVLGDGPHIKWSTGSSRLQKAANAVADNPCVVSSFNLHYTDTGLLGIHIMCNKNDAGKVVKSVWSEFTKLAKSGLNEEELKIAKKKLQVSINMKMESTDFLLESMILNPEHSDETSNLDTITSEIQQLNIDQINQFTKKLSLSKPTMAAIGNLKTLQYLDDLRQ
ncbi:unnamed protein product [Didymodactylos carnosus]|uniref:Uncharacterized protein n=1 Tax=Didymodactylos carnosus TaxID=1234261 RepID=A0A814KQR7_9BILA|nr:unnamed protein product [Didymodactylos carnosus]CAF1052891.1 unnamed protein product [Didymodactylos carnosus]CAF3703774.1 unnamed protein product [Didymodactylos carnosus]CAF3822262.1 unnamed protein product [Didymodactylos carnosus]